MNWIQGKFFHSVREGAEVFRYPDWLDDLRNGIAGREFDAKYPWVRYMLRTLWQELFMIDIFGEGDDLVSLYFQPRIQSYPPDINRDVAITMDGALIWDTWDIISTYSWEKPRFSQITQKTRNILLSIAHFIESSQDDLTKKIRTSEGISARSLGIYNDPTDPDITKWKSDPGTMRSLMQAGGTIVKGTPWNPEYRDSKNQKDNISRIFYTHDKYQKFTESLLSQIQEKGSIFDAVLTMPRWGVAIWAHIAQWLGIDLGYVHAQSYGTSQQSGDLELGDFILPKSLRKKLDLYNADKKHNPRPRALLVDDMADTGKTLRATKQALEDMGFLVEVAVIFEKVTSSVKCAYALFRKMNGWIDQPGEGTHEWPTKGHNVWNTASHGLTQASLQIVTILRRVLASLWDPKRVIQFIIWKNDPYPWILAAASRSFPRKQLASFHPERPNSFGELYREAEPIYKEATLVISVVGGNVIAVLEDTTRKAI